MTLKLDILTDSPFDAQPWYWKQKSGAEIYIVAITLRMPRDSDLLSGPTGDDQGTGNFYNNHSLREMKLYLRRIWSRGSNSNCMCRFTMKFGRIATQGFQALYVLERTTGKLFTEGSILEWGPQCNYSPTKTTKQSPIWRLAILLRDENIWVKRADVEITKITTKWPF